MNSSNILEGLKAKGFRLTGVRKRLVEFILSRPGHWTIQQLSEEAKKKLPSVGIATIYRTVQLLQRENVLTETRVASASARYELSRADHHDHLTCTTCGEIFEFENDQIEVLQLKVAKQMGFKLKDHRMELYATCVRPRCPFLPKTKK